MASRQRNLDQAEKGLEFTLGNAISRTGKTYIQKKERERERERPKITMNKPQAVSHVRRSVKTEPAL